jgi:5'-3' exonuclease
MGIKHLNRFLRDEAQSSINFILLEELSGKKLAVDISIYMYKYASEGCLLENMYLMLSTFRYYNIELVFIFDGKPPPEKKELLQKRKEDKQDAENEYKILNTYYKRCQYSLK